MKKAVIFYCVNNFGEKYQYVMLSEKDELTMIKEATSRNTEIYGERFLTVKENQENGDVIVYL